MVNHQHLSVLVALDRAKTQWYHFTAIVVTGMGFLTDAYDLFCISTVTRLLGRIYFYEASTGEPGALPPMASSFVNGVALIGTLVGQLFFGWLGDKLGRKKVYGVTLLLMVLSSIASSLTFGTTGNAVIGTLCFFRFWLGFGIGGDYPLSATIMAEYSNTKTRGAFIAAVFAMQGIGILAGAAVAIGVSAAFNAAFLRPAFSEDPPGSTALQADYVWRIILAVGALPAILTYYWRLKLPETARYTALVEGKAQQASEDMASILNMQYKEAEAAESGKSCVVQEADEETLLENHEPLTERGAKRFGLLSTEFAKKHGLHLLGTTACWFFVDIGFYSSNLFQKDVLTAANWLPDASSLNAIEEVYEVSRSQALIALCSTVPGYWVTVLTIDFLGRFVIQLQGFLFMTGFMLAIAIPYNYWQTQSPIVFVVLYACTFFFSNFGPNSTTFIVPAEIFPAKFRSTCHGISAAAGRVGAILGAFGFQTLWDSEAVGHSRTLILLAVCNAAGVLFTFLIPETKGRSLEEISGESDYHLMEDTSQEPTASG